MSKLQSHPRRWRSPFNRGDGGDESNSHVKSVTGALEEIDEVVSSKTWNHTRNRSVKDLVFMDDFALPLT